MNIYIVTGASKGIGFEIFTQLKVRGEKVIGVARSNPSQETDFLTMDLSKSNQLDSFMTKIIEENLADATSFTLINNAGMVDPIGLMGTVPVDKVMNAIAVNLTAPIVLSNAFIHSLKTFKGTKRILNISSGAGRNAYEGWGIYCTTKAGLDHFSRVVALEQAKEEHPVEIMSIAPGIIDTGMQETIRNSKDKDFPLLEQFIEYKKQGALSSAEETAAKLIAVLDLENFNAIGTIADIRNI